jgi:hypothetical protein
MFVRCLLPSSCIGGTKVCAPPYVGPLCSGCDVGFHINTDWSCSKYVFASFTLGLRACLTVYVLFVYSIFFHLSLSMLILIRCPDPVLNKLRIFGISIAVFLGCIGSVYMAIASAESQVTMA